MDQLVKDRPVNYRKFLPALAALLGAMTLTAIEIDKFELKDYRASAYHVAARDVADGDVIQVKEAVPDVKHCLRYDRKSGEYLLLIASNLRETAKVKFTVSGVKLPAILTDYFERVQVATDGKSFEVKLEPHGVRAYRFR